MHERLIYDERISFPIEDLIRSLEGQNNVKKFFEEGQRKGKRFCTARKWFNCTGGVWVKTPAQVYLYVECGMALPALSGCEIKHSGRSKGPKWDYICKLCRTRWGKAAPDDQCGQYLKQGVNRWGYLVEIFDGLTVVHLLMLDPPDDAWKPWGDNRTLYYRK